MSFVLKIKNSIIMHLRAFFTFGGVILCGFVTGCSLNIDEIDTLHGNVPDFTANSVNLYSTEANGALLSVGWIADEYCVPEDKSTGSTDGLTDNNAVFLFDVSNNEVLISKNLDSKIYPASTTKILTALVLMEEVGSGRHSLDEKITIKETNGGITRIGAQLSGLQKGDVVTLNDLLNLLMVYSANDAGIAIAQCISGDVDSFVVRMNATAKRIGATHTAFKNPHGLHEAEHNTTAYDMYLIFRELTKEAYRPAILPVLKNHSYTLNYEDKNGNKNTKVYEATNMYFLTEEGIEGLPFQAIAPEKVVVYGGKTGSTTYAGDCLILMSECNDKLFFSAVFGASTKESMYRQMTKLLEAEQKYAE